MKSNLSEKSIEKSNYPSSFPLQRPRERSWGRGWPLPWHLIERRVSKTVRYPLHSEHTDRKKWRSFLGQGSPPDKLTGFVLCWTKWLSTYQQHHSQAAHSSQDIISGSLPGYHIISYHVNLIYFKCVEMKGKDTRGYPYRGYPPTTWRDHNTRNSVFYKERTIFTRRGTDDKGRIGNFFVLCKHEAIAYIDDAWNATSRLIRINILFRKGWQDFSTNPCRERRYS